MRLTALFALALTAGLGVALPSAAAAPGTQVPLTAAAADTHDFSGTYAASGGVERGGVERGGHACMPRLQLGVGADSPSHVVVGRRVIALVQPEQHRVRRIYLDVPHPDRLAPSVLGDSIGWWDGDTLVIETIGLKSGQTLIERIRPLSGGRQLEITAGGRVQWAELLSGQRWLDDGCVGAVKPAATGSQSVPQRPASEKARGPAAVKSPAPPDFEGAWQIETPVTGLRTSRAQLPPFNAVSRKLYEERQALLAAGAAADYDESRRCQPLGPIRSEQEGTAIDIIQGESEIFVGAAGNRMGRIAYLQKSRERPARHSYAGQWVGHWDGEVLVLEGAGFNGRTLLDAEGMPHSAALHVVQRMKLLEQGQRLEVRTAYGDPDTFTQAWQTLQYYRRLPDARLAGAQSSPCYNVP